MKTRERMTHRQRSVLVGLLRRFRQGLSLFRWHEVWTKRLPSQSGHQQRQHLKAAAGQLLSISIATLASKPNNARIVKESPHFIGECFREVSALCR